MVKRKYHGTSHFKPIMVVLYSMLLCLCFVCLLYELVNARSDISSKFNLTKFSVWIFSSRIKGRHGQGSPTLRVVKWEMLWHILAYFYLWLIEEYIISLDHHPSRHPQSQRASAQGASASRTSAQEVPAMRALAYEAFSLESFSLKIFHSMSRWV